MILCLYSITNVAVTYDIKLYYSLKRISHSEDCESDLYWKKCICLTPHKPVALKQKKTPVFVDGLCFKATSKPNSR